MKLHLTKSLRTALLACVCGAVASTAWAETLNLTSGSTAVGSVTDAYSEIVVNDGANLDFKGTDNTTDKSNPVTFDGDVSIAGDGNDKWGVLTVDSNGSANGRITGTLTSTADSDVYLWGDRELTVNELQLSEGTLKLNPNGSANGTLNVTTNVSGEGSMKVERGTVNVEGTVTLSETSTLTINSGATLKINNAISNSGKLVLNGVLDATGVDLSTLSSTTTAESSYSDADNGFYGTWSTYNNLIEGEGTLELSGVKLMTEKGAGVLDTDGSARVQNHNGTYYVNTGTVNGADLGDAKAVEVAAGATLQYASANNHNGLDITLKAGTSESKSSMQIDKDAHQVMEHNTITLEGNAQITGADSNGIILEDAKIIASGTGNEISSVISVRKTDGTIDVDGEDSELTISGAVKYNQYGEYENVTETAVLTKTGEGTLILAAKTTVDKNVAIVLEEGTLDLSNVTTLTLGSLNLAAGSTIKLGEGTRITFTDSLTIEEGVIFDLSSWCSYDEFTPYELFTYAGSAEGYSPTLPTNVTILTSDGLTNELAWLDYDADTQKVKLIPEPTTATLSLLALAGLAARRRRK